MSEKITDQRILNILKEVAYERTEEIGGSPYCVFRHDEPKNSIFEEVDDIDHGTTCPTTIARNILREQGIPLCVYHISYERSLNRSKTWVPMTIQVQGFLKEEVEAEVSKWFTSTHMGRNVHITFLHSL